MTGTVLLDSSPLGLITHPLPDISTEMARWSLDLLANGWQIAVPAIIYYEVQRELLRAGKVKGLRNLDRFTQAVPDRYLPLSDRDLRLAATLWADARRRGRPTGDPNGLDIDVILAAQALSLGPGAIVATSNVKHLEQFCDARHWSGIRP